MRHFGVATEEMRSAKNVHAWVTGFPSRKSTAIAARLLEDGHTVSLLARDAHQAERALGKHASLKVLEGEPWGIDFSLSALEYNGLTRDLTHIFHIPNARIGSGHVEAARDCISSTGEVLSLLRDLRPNAQLTHVSTVLTLRGLEGVAREDMRADPKRHRSHVLQAYSHAERMVDADVSGRSCIVRTGIAFGDSRTGDFEPGSWGHVLAAFVLDSPDDLPLPIPVPELSTLNLIPTDYLARAVVALSLRDVGPSSECFHVVDGKPYGARRVLELLAEAVGRGPLRYSVPSTVWQALWRAPLVGAAAGRGRAHVVEGLIGSSLYDATNARAALGSLADECPDFASYVKPVVDHMKAHKQRGGSLLDAGLSDDDIPG